MKKFIFIVNGKPRSGKDTFAEILSQYTGVYKVSSVDRVKKIATMCGWDGAKEEKDRKFLSDLKLLISDYSDVIFQDMRNHVRIFKKDKKSDTQVLLIDIREPEEIDRAKKEFGAYTLQIKNNRVPNVTTNMADANVDNYRYDFSLDNNGTLEEFRREIEMFYVSVLGGVIIEESNEKTV